MSEPNPDEIAELIESATPDWTYVVANPETGEPERHRFDLDAYMHALDRARRERDN